MTGFRRSSGILLPVASLPGGRMGDAALRFVDWLADAGQTWWQILPFGPPDEYGSPYAASLGVRRRADVVGRAATRR